MEDDSSSSANEIMTRVDSKSNVQRQQLFDTGSDEKAAITSVQVSLSCHCLWVTYFLKN